MGVRSLTHKWTVKYLSVILMVLLTNTVESMARKINFSNQRRQEIEFWLKQLNKQAIKSIESPNGEIIDCISITNQPAFDHPMLKNHTIQMIPSSYPREDYTYEGNSSARSADEEPLEDIVQLWQLEGDCPKSTIPIKRITKEDLLRVDDINSYGKKVSHYSNISRSDQIHHPKGITNQDNGHEYAITYVKDGVFRGAKAYINIWKPHIQTAGELSISQIWVIGGSDFGPSMTTVEAGWNVSPTLYRGKKDPRIFVYWTRDGYKNTGCYNLICPGFVQVSETISLGAALKVSTYGGQQYKLSVQLWKDPDTGNWWLQLNEKDLIGYWPAELLPNLGKAANQIEWGGEVLNLKQGGKHTTTEMGSGHFPSEGSTKASYFRAMKIIDMANLLRDPTKVQTLVTRPTCYDIKTGYSKSWGGAFFYFGGPGHNPRCP